MKRIKIVSIVAVVLVLLAFAVVGAEAGRRHGWCGHGWHHPGPAAFLARDLKLSDAQKTQIRALWQAESPAISADIHEFLNENREMDAIAAQGNPDPGKVREIADREAATIAQLLVEKEQLQFRIESTVLNPEQRARPDALEKKWESRLDDAAHHLAAETPEKQ